MDLAIEANRNSALFNTMQDVLDVYNPLLHKARPTIVNQTKHRIRVKPTRWANTMSDWNGTQSVRFDLPRIGSLVDFSLKCAFQIPGVAPDEIQRKATGDRGFATETNNSGGLSNSVAGTGSLGKAAAGRLDRVYADRLLGFNMIKQYTVSSKSRQIFTASGEYLLVRFSQMDEDMKKSVMRACTPVDIMDPDVDSMFYSPGISYVMNIPLFMFFNEHITSALDVNFSEEVHIDIEMKPPSQLFYYGQLGDLTQRNDLAVAYAAQSTASNVQTYSTTANGTTTGAGTVTWDQAIHDQTGGVTAIINATLNQSTALSGTVTLAITGGHSYEVGGTIVLSGCTPTTWNGTHKVLTVTTTEVTFFNALIPDGDITVVGTLNKIGTDSIGVSNANLSDSEIVLMQDLSRRHIQGVGSYFDSWGTAYGTELGTRTSGPTFAFHDVNNEGKSVQLQFEANADYIVQDTDAYRALRQQQFPEGTGLTTITYDTAQECFQTLMGGVNSSNLLDTRSGGTFTDPSQNRSGITMGDQQRFVDLPIRSNTLALASHFMVRKHSDMGGSGNTVGSTGVAPFGIGGKLGATNVLGAHRTYTRALPVHYFQVLAAGRVIYESDGDSQIKLTQSGMYNGTGMEWGTKTDTVQKRNNLANDLSASNSRPFNIYSINWGLQASRLENSGCLSFQNLNNPTLRIFFKPDTWAEYSPKINSNTTKSDALVAAEMGVQVDLIHEHFNVITINSGNGEITSGLNQ